MTDVDLESLKRDDNFCVDLGKSVWLMDNLRILVNVTDDSG